MSQSSPYYFVAPSDPDGDRFAYSKTGAGHPSPVFVQAAWEWLLERAVRRTVLLELVGREDVPLNLSERAGMYRVPCLLCPAASSFAPEPPFDASTRASYLPWIGVPGEYSMQTTAFTPSGVPGLVAGLLSAGGADGTPGASPPFWFCDPSAWPSERSVDASYHEETEVDEPEHDPADDVAWSCRTSVVHRPYPVDGILPVFRPLGDMRLDEADEASVPVWDPSSGEFAERRMVCPRTRFPRSFDDDPDHGEIRYVRIGHDGALPGEESVPVMVLPGLTDLSARFAVGCRVNADLRVYEGSARWPWVRRDDPSAADPCMRDSMDGYVGWQASAPSPSRTGLCFVSADPSFRGTVHPAPDWDGKASCWEAWGLPDLGAVPGGSVFRRQLEATCSARPCIPPSPLALPASDDADGAQFSRRYPLAWTVPVLPSDASGAEPVVPCAATPVNASLVLDRLRVTVHPVDRLYARVEGEVGVDRAVRTDYREESSDGASLRGVSRDSWEISRTVRGAFVGTMERLFGLGGGYNGLNNGDPDGSALSRKAETYVTVDLGASPAGRRSSSEEESYSERTSSSVLASGLSALRPGVSESGGLLTRTLERHESESSGNYFGDGETYRSGQSYAWSGGEASGYVPEDSDLLFHPSVMAWMERAELFAVVRVVSSAEGGDAGGYLERDTRPAGSPATRTRSSSRAGSRTSRGRYRVVSLGEMDLETGEFPDLDVSALVSASLPHGGGTGFDFGGTDDEDRGVSSERTWTSTTYQDGSVETVDEGSDETPEFCTNAVELCLAYVAVEWKFDSEEPPPAPSGGGTARAATAARADLSAARSAARRASAALSSVRTRLSRLSASLSSLSGVLSGGQPARTAAVDAARAALSAAQAAESDAASAVSDAAEDVSDAAEAVPSADSDPAAVDAALSALLAAQAALRSARADLAGARAEVSRLSVELSDMEAAAAVDQAAAEAALSDAEDAADAAEDAADAAEDLERPSSAAADAADAALRAVPSASDKAAAARDAQAAARAALSAAQAFEEAAEDAVDAAADAESAYAAAFAAAWGA